jgi:hypothetical protein
MTNRKTLTIILLIVLIFFFGEVWQLFENASGEVDYFPLLDYTLDIQWYVKMAGEKVSDVLKAVVIVMLARLYFDIKVVGVGYLVFNVVDLALFFLCFNTCSYVLVYLGVMIFTVAYWYHRKYGVKFSKPRKEQGVQVSDTTMLSRDSTVKFIKRNLEVRVD